MQRWKQYQLPEDFPTGTFGSWTIDRIALEGTELDAANLRLIIGGFCDRTMEPGSYVRLRKEGYCDPIMSDTPAEIRDLYPLVDAVVDWGWNPTVLLHGLGLGVALRAAVLEGASKITVVEKDKDLLDFVGAYWKDYYRDTVELIHDDAMTWSPKRGAKWDIVWHDIWPAITSDNLKDMHKLHRRFGKRSRWQGSWCRNVCEDSRSGRLDRIRNDNLKLMCRSWE